MTSEMVFRIVVYLALAAFVVFRLSRERKFSMSSLWVWPAVLVVIVVLDVWLTKVSSVLDLAYMFVALIGGSAFGWYLGSHSTIRIDKAAKAAHLRSSPIGIALFVAAMGVRVGARYFSGGMNTSTSDAGQLSPAAALATAITLAFAVGLFIGQRLYVKQKYDETPA